MYSVSGGVVSLVGMVIWHWYALKTEVNVYRKLNIKTITDHVSKAYFAKSIVKRTFAELHVYSFKAQATLERGRGLERQLQRMHPFFFRYRLDILHGYSVESTLCSYIDSRAYIFYTMLELFKHLGYSYISL